MTSSCCHKSRLFGPKGVRFVRSLARELLILGIQKNSKACQRSTPDFSKTSDKYPRSCARIVSIFDACWRFEACAKYQVGCANLQMRFSERRKIDEPDRGVSGQKLRIESCQPRLEKCQNRLRFANGEGCFSIWPKCVKKGKEWQTWAKKRQGMATIGRKGQGMANSASLRPWGPARIPRA